MRKARAFLAILLLVGAAADGSVRRRAVARLDPSESPEAWLWRNGHALQSVDHPAPAADLEPLRDIAGHASVVGLGDGTHGTREFYTSKLRMIDFLVRETDFDVVAFEAPFPLFNRLNEYVQGGAGDPRALLRESNERLGYRFWDVEEMLAVVEWMRDYNAGRGSRPSIAIAGADVYDGVGASRAVVDSLRRVDPSAASDAEREYGCVSPQPSPACMTVAAEVRDRLAQRRAELEPLAGAVAFEEALQNARIVVQSMSHFTARDPNMAANVGWILEHRSRSGRIIVWAHQEHIGKSGTLWIPSESMGWHLAMVFGDRYVAIGSLTGRGTILQWAPPGTPVAGSIPPPLPGSYESFFSLRPARALLIPLRREVPDWLAGPAFYFTSGTARNNAPSIDSLPAKLDAIVYIEETTATRPLEH
ncbi:MAG TPA: erythromycin esterase family protein [Thermoanaerobaculia bacterium]|nr:erythromycin esterase family protein [Thermoanaerobaculia bacterium]